VHLVTHSILKTVSVGQRKKKEIAINPIAVLQNFERKKEIAINSIAVL
jgi:hypothetical protein